MGGVPGNPIISDIIQNIVLFTPFGFLGYFSLVYKRSLLNKLSIVLGGTALSAFVECLQIFSKTRHPALSDVIFNTLGTAVGLCAAILLKRSVMGFKSHPVARRFLDSESAFPAFIFLLLTVAGSWQPFDFSMDVSLVWGHVKPLLQDPIRFSRPDDDIVGFIRFLLTGLFVCRMANEVRLRRPVLWGMAVMGIFGVGLELSQVFIESRSPELQDALVSLMGAACGGIAFYFPGFHRRPRVWSAAGGLAVLVSAAARTLYPYDFTDQYGGFNWILFLPQYQGSTFAAIGNFMESAMVYFPIGFLLGYFYPRLRPSALAALLAGVMALALEAAQGFVPGRYPDVTDVFGAMLGAIAGGITLTRGWPAFREYMRRDDDNQV
ncbi:MAG: VanZ family protein [Fibrobacterota bacterium]|nr:VanZ family protein [Fibrobacterota bacterium]